MNFGYAAQGLDVGQGSGRAARGTTQNGLRLYNERLALSLIRQYGQLPKAEIARLTGLSAQTVSVIVRHLERDKLVLAGAKQRGKVGQPLVPFKLNPDGAFAIGLKVGRRSGDMVLLDLTGNVRAILRQPYHFPTPKQFLAFAEKGIKTLTTKLPKAMRGRISGLGIAAPFELWNWEEEVGAPHEVLEAWRDFDLMGEVAKLCDFPVHPCNDATAACSAELLFGRGATVPDYAYFYVGYFIGGGLVLNGSLFQGHTGNAGALGSIPVPRHGGGSEQLIRSASLYTLEQALRESGLNPNMLWNLENEWSDAGKLLDDWITKAARGMAQASAAIASILECREIVIDGAMPPNVRKKLVEATAQALKHTNMSGITPFNLREGAIGRDARAIGAASLPLFANFIIDRDILFKEAF
ncbi:MAG: ROK family transcriptional regulator [Alphaproteobacteria bacterium]|nr:ROK family transcriptional regulator [Alphaproteobacteria bacterium]